MNVPPSTLYKLYRRGTHRVISPSETLERLQPMLGNFGISRVADITGLDTIGIPVAVAVRPGSRSNITSQGKGLDKAAAKVSAIMESIEACCAERLTGPLIWAHANEMRTAGRSLIDYDHLIFHRGHRFNAETRILWFEGRHLAKSASCWLPFECVHTNFTLPRPAGSGHFVASTNGLASGNSAREAIVHGLCELIERDAQVLFSLDPSYLDSRRVDLASIMDPEAIKLLKTFAAKGFVSAVWDLTSDVGVAVFKCHIMERRGGPGLMPLPAEGHGCHPDRGVALLRAILEAVQSRAVMIAGTRDDVGPDLYERYDDMQELARWRGRLGSETSARRYEAIPHAFHETVDDDIEYIERRLQGIGLGDIIAIDLLSEISSPISVVRVVVPGLEGPLEPDAILGPRARWQRERAL